MEKLTMFIILRKDLIKTLGWPSGSVIAQACHASTAALHQYKNLDTTQQYLDDLNNMHKVVLETKNENSLISISDKLVEINIPFIKWVEQPEAIPTCIATAPILRSQLGEALKKCSLYKA